MSDTFPQHRERRLPDDGTGWDARSWVKVAVGRNPLIGRHHRREAWIIVTAVLLLVVATVISAGAGAAVYSARIGYHEAEKASWTLVSAKAIEFSAMPVDSHKPIHRVRACWPALGRQHCDTIELDHPVARGNDMPIWIDRTGQYVPTSDPARQALTDAVVAGFVVWCALAALVAAVTTAWRRRLARFRESGMDAELATLLGTQTGRDGHQPGQ